MPYRITFIDWLLFAGLVTCWGFSFVMSKIALQDVTPVWIAAIRLVIGACILAIAAALAGKPLPRAPRQLAGYVWLGFIGNAAPFLAITWAMQFIASGVAGLLMGTIPLFVILLAHFALPGERLTLPRSAGFILGFIGIIVLVGPEKLTALSLHGKELIGEAAVVLGCLMYGLNAISAKRLALSGGPAVAAAVLGAGAMMALLAASLSAPPPDWTAIHLTPALALFGLGLFPTGLATVMWFKAVERTSPTFTALSNYLVPVFSLVAGHLLLDEPIGWNILVALLLILGGIFISRFDDIRQLLSR